MLISELYHPHAITVEEDATVVEALEVFLKKKVNGLVVVNEKDMVVGVLALQDIAAATIPRPTCRCCKEPHVRLNGTLPARHEGGRSGDRGNGPSCRRAAWPRRHLEWHRQ